MSNKTKSSAVVVITVSNKDFFDALASIRNAGINAKAALVTAAKFIGQATNKADQDKAKRELSIAYKAFADSTSIKPITKDAATKWVQRNVKSLSGNPKFKWLVSKTAAAAKKRAARAGGKVEAAEAAPVAPKATVTSIEKVRDALIAKEKKNLDDFINIIPSGKIKEFEQAYAAFIQTLEIILK
jgi:hypothetical protein